MYFLPLKEYLVVISTSFLQMTITFFPVNYADYIFKSVDVSKLKFE